MARLQYKQHFESITRQTKLFHVRIEGDKRDSSGRPVLKPGTNEAEQEVIYELENVEAPADWSQHAVNIAASKYFAKTGVPNERGKEYSVFDMMNRVAKTITRSGVEQGYFEDLNAATNFQADLTEILLSQKAAFNSPVWFNVGLYHEYGIKGEGVNFGWCERHPDYDAAVDGPVGAKPGVYEISEYYRRPQASACFIQPIEDSIPGISKLLAAEALVFKGGSGSGSNFSAIRSRWERLSQGGLSSGLISFLKVFDAAAGAVKSGGTTRRAAKMVVLNADHPEVFDFVGWKSREEKKAKALIAAGYDSDLNGEAYQTVSGQNANNSIRVTDAFMKAVANNEEWSTTYRTTGKVHETFPARKLFRTIAQSAWECGDPGLQYDDALQAWHTVPNVGRINATNPCQPAWAPILTPVGIKPFGHIHEGDLIWSGQAWTRVTKKWSTGIKPVFKYKTRAGTFVGTEDHRVVSNGEKLPIKEATTIDISRGPTADGGFLIADGPEVLAGLLIGDGGLKICNDGRQEYPLLYIGENDQDYFGSEVKDLIRMPAFDKTAYRVETTLKPEYLRLKTYERRVPDEFYYGARSSMCRFLRGLYSANGSICGGRVTLKATSLTLIEQVQTMLSALGIRSYYTVNKAQDVTFANGTYTCRESYDLNITYDKRWFAHMIGFIQKDKTARLMEACESAVGSKPPKASYEITEVERLGEEEVFDMTVEAEEHTYWTGGLLVSNCSEFAHVDDSACNLSSINLIKFLLPDGGFDVDGYEHTIECLIIAMDILVDLSSYPTRNIANVSHHLRPLGIGYANLGSLLMAKGLAYDSEEARQLAGVLTSILSAKAYLTSISLARELGAFGWHDQNKHAMLTVMQKHRAAHIDANFAKNTSLRGLDAVAAHMWNMVVTHGVPYGFRNSQISLLAPTGTISFLMGCATTGVEPDFALVKVKKLVGGGKMYIVNDMVRLALERLGYPEELVKQLLKTVESSGTPTKHPALKKEHESIFDCALPAYPGGSFISPMGHLQMVAAVQPFLSGAVSKTINVPAEATVEQIEELYMEAWKLGIKALIVYRDGCKLSQPLNTGKEAKKGEKPLLVVEAPPVTSGYVQTLPEAQAEIARLKGLIEHHMNQQGDDRCWEDDGELYEKALGVKGWTPKMLPKEHFLQNCAKFWECQTKGVAYATPTPPKRRRLSIQRKGTTYELRIGGEKLYLRTGEYSDGSLGEIFLDMHKQGSMMRALLGNFAIAISLGLQYGVPLEEYVDVFTFSKFAPSGVTNHPNVKQATSALDLVFRILGLDYLGREDLCHVKPSDLLPEVSEPTKAIQAALVSPAPAGHTNGFNGTSGGLQMVTQSDAPHCPSCGELTVRNGSCYKCNHCGESLGCS